MKEGKNILIILDYLSVLVYGILIMVFFLDIKLNKKNILLISVYVLFCVLLQAQLYNAYSNELIAKLYPLMIHLPLTLFFCFVLKRKLNLVLFVLFTSYFFTAPRRWIGELVASYFDNDLYVLVITKIIASVILLFLIYKYLRPYVNRIMRYSNKRINLLTVVPAITYIVSYGTTVYTDILYKSSMLVIGLFSVGFTSVFYLFIVAYFIEMDKSFDLQIEQTVLKMQSDATLIQIDQYKKTQLQDAIYRHDLRHHLQFLSTSIAENHKKEALEYISRINKLIEATYVRQICENTNVNLILSAYEVKAKNSNINIEINAIVPMEIPFDATDVCVILSNGIENAINALNGIDADGDKKIYVSCKYENKKLMIEICNPYEGEISFKDDLPISTKEKHGLGVRSIVSTVEKQNGVCSFTVKDKIFTMQVII